ncbi:LacI family DNA-binding transcriptional regulator [Leifsonia sp. LS-T14]|uniref:LacI family DNA-binding transcriptional regulator n=1 Tax=unclassified Leifsonia TaxID=2663824 RepID=UPI0035A57B82
MTATLHDVSRLAGVSIKTVSNVINDYPYVSDATRAKVLAAISELDYTPNLSARSLRSGRTNVISLLIPELRNAYFAELADSVMREASKHGLSVLIEQFGNDRESELSVLRNRGGRSVDGILYSVLTLDESDREIIAGLKAPTVLLGDRIFNGTTDHVTMQNAEGARAATALLLDRGRRRIVALGAHPGEVTGSGGLRLAGYREALQSAGIDVDERLILPAGTWHRADGAQAIRDFLSRDIPFDGVVAFNDTLALGALRVLQEEGFRVPGDVAIIGFDDLDETNYSMPTLSTVDPGRDAIARRAVELLVRRIDGADSSGAEEIAVPFRIIERESTALTVAVP